MAKGKGSGGNANKKFGIIGGKGAPSSVPQVKPTRQLDVVEWIKQEAEKSAQQIASGHSKSKSKFAPRPKNAK